MSFKKTNFILMPIDRMHSFFKKSKGLKFDLLIILLSTIIPILVSQFTAENPQSRYIHIENFRYGKNPSEIRCNRGDTLHLTFSSRDTGHSFFLEEFDIDVKVNPGNGKVLEFKASDPGIPPLIKDTVTIIAEHTGIYKNIISKSNYRCHVWCGPLHAFEQGNLIISPNLLLNFGIGFLLGLFFVALRRVQPFDEKNIQEIYDDNQGIDLLTRFPSIKKIIQKSWFQPSLMLLGGVFLYVGLLTTIVGTQMSGRNLGIMLVWIVWLFFLVVVLTPLGGRSWCMICPLPMAGEFLQRRAITNVRSGKTNGYRNKFFGLNLSWPEALRNGWLRLVFFMITGTLSTTFVAKPIYTGIAILTLLFLATVMAMIWKFRSFCQFICPINAFIGLYSKLGKLTVRKIEQSTCDSCKPEFCEFGNQNGWACPYELNIKTLDSNYECGMCTECVRSCVYDNVTFKWRKFGSEALISDASTAWTAIAMLVLGINYCLVYLGHWPVLRDFVNIIDKSNWGLFGIYTTLLWSSALFFVPALFYGITYISKLISGVKEKTWELMIASSGALLPIGLFVWIAFVIQMLFTNVTFIFQSLSDPFGWGWNLLGFAGTPWTQFFPRLVPWIQVISLLFGFYYSARNLTRIWILKADSRKLALIGMLPILTFLMFIAGGMIWFFAN